MAGPIMFVVAFLILLGWGIYNKRRLPPWWPGDEPAELIAFRTRLDAMTREIGVALLPAMRSLAGAASTAAESFEKFGAALAAAFEKESS